MQPESNAIQIDISVYESQLRGEIASDLSTLQLVEDAASRADYGSSKYTLKQGFTISEISVPPVEFLRQREINKCFKSIVGSLQDYLDKLIAVVRLANESITMQQGSTWADVDKLLREKFEHHLLQVSTDHKLNVQKKLDILLDEPEQQTIKDSVRSFFDIRNGIEHHKSIAKIDRALTYRRIGLASTAGYEMSKVGPLGPGEGLVMKTFEEKIPYDKGGFLLITRPQLDGIVLSLLIFTLPIFQKAAAKKLNSATLATEKQDRAGKNPGGV